MGVQSHIGVHFVLKILLGAEGGRSHKTSRSYNRGLTMQGPLYTVFTSALAIANIAPIDVHFLLTTN